MRREGRKAHRDRLLVADIDEDLVEDRQRGLVGGRPKPALMQDCGESERLQRHRLAAGVRAADHERAEGAELEVDRNGGARLEQRMASSAENDLVARSHERPAPAAREPSPREREVELRRRGDECRERLRLRADERREVAQDARRPRRVRRPRLRGVGSSRRPRRVARRRASVPSPRSRGRCPVPVPRADAFSASTGRPARSVTKSSWRCSASAGSRAILRSRSASRPRPSRSSRRSRRS